MSFFELPPVTFALEFCSFFDGMVGSPIFIDIIDKLPAVLAPVGQHVTAGNVHVFEYRNGIFDISALPLAYYNSDRIAVCVNRRMDFCAVSAAAMANFIHRPIWGLQRYAGGSGQWRGRWKFRLIPLQG